MMEIQLSFYLIKTHLNYYYQEKNKILIKETIIPSRANKIIFLIISDERIRTSNYVLNKSVFEQTIEEEF